MKYCPNCGKEIVEGAAFCDNCGTKLEYVDRNNREEILNQGLKGRGNLTNRSIPLCIILSLVTCGLYSLYWFVVMTDDANSLLEDEQTSGVLSLVLFFVTCGIYGIYWNYQMGKKLYDAGNKNHVGIQDYSILYLVLSLLGFTVVNYCLIQNDLNKFSA